MTPILFAQSPDEVEGLAAFGVAFLDAYQKSMRSSLFTGFLTLCGFLMSAKTFIVVNMKKEVYDQDSYLLNFDTQRQLKAGMKAYAPLDALSRSLLLNVWASLITSALQFTVGFVPFWWAAAICVSAAVVTLIILAGSLLRIRSNLKDMFMWLEAEAESKIQRARERAKSSGASPHPAPPPPNSPKK